jgi:hypothetical protein
MGKSSAGRKPLDTKVMFRTLILQALNNLSRSCPEHLLPPFAAAPVAGSGVLL